MSDLTAEQIAQIEAIKTMADIQPDPAAPIVETLPQTGAILTESGPGIVYQPDTPPPTI